ncbi:N-acetylglucosamine kinase [Streptomyces oceani]|uniref:ATPase n=1 Tax=Streptomyces oceani TaxID=1075402 RepID=A0A1E7KG73_9ACTN|nr:BadF/BadG/BcrA/BcrD ATPase family protein [Streptomyces oceani]OEV02921.1 ATPase [Streptomyces oceani]
MSADAACLAIDAGNSKSDVAVVRVDGTVLGSARGGGFQPPTVGAEAAVHALGRTVRRAVECVDEYAAGGRADVCQDVRVSDHLSDEPAPVIRDVSACLANADLPREEEELANRLREHAWGTRTHTVNDTFAILRAGLPDTDSTGPGVAVVCGAGINCVGRDGEGTTHRFPAIGRLSGDWGGGGGLADEALWFAARAEDGRGEATRLARALPEHFALPSMYALIEALHLGDLAPGSRHAIPPILFEVAAAGDPVARALVHRQADEIVALVTVTLRRLALLDRPAPVLLGGGVLAVQHPMLHDRLLEQLADQAPLASPRLVSTPPVLGAALLGLDRLGAFPSAYARLRRHYAA